MITDEQIFESKILVLDDELDNVTIIEKLLKLEGFAHIKTITDPREAKATYQDFMPDLVLLDLSMPHMNGFQVMEEIKKIEKGPYLSFLVLTALSDEETLLKAFNCGAKDFVNKPFNAAEMIARIRNLLEVRLLNKSLEEQKQALEGKVKERTKELHDTRLEVVRRLGMAAEFRDNETGLHIIRMSKMCELLGASIGFCDSECDLLLNASPMHDIGKIGIPDRVLLKHSKLDPEEWEIMKTHAQIGADLLSGDSELMEMASSIALTHHEKWDGAGYPNGLKGEDIPLSGRIAALCDVFDALTSNRPYKKAWSIEDSCAEIKSCNGTHFEPRLVEKFIQILPDIIAITKEYADPEDSSAIK